MLLKKLYLKTIRLLLMRRNSALKSPYVYYACKNTLYSISATWISKNCIMHIQDMKCRYLYPVALLSLSDPWGGPWEEGLPGCLPVEALLVFGSHWTRGQEQQLPQLDRTCAFAGMQLLESTCDLTSASTHKVASLIMKYFKRVLNRQEAEGTSAERYSQEFLSFRHAIAPSPFRNSTFS